MGIILFVLVGIGLLDPSETELTPWIGVTSLLFIGVYLGSVRLLYLHARHTGSNGSFQPTLDGDFPAGHDPALMSAIVIIGLTYSTRASVSSWLGTRP